MLPGVSNPIQVDAATGFLQSYSPNFQTFDADKKTQFLRLALEQAQAGEWPDIEALCKAFNITSRTFYGHKKNDTVFADAWEEVKRAVVHDIAKTMHTHSKRPGNYMDRVTLLRHLYPEEWGGERKPESFQDVSWLKRAIELTKPTIIDGEIVKPTTNQLDSTGNGTENK